MSSTSDLQEPVRAGHQRKDPTARRTEIVDAAIDIFGRQGYRQGSLREVAAAVGLTVPGVLHHFPTKEALLAAALDQRNHRRRDQLQTVLADQGVIALGRYLLTENLAYPGLMRLIVTLSAEATDPDHPARQYFLDRYQVTHEVIKDGFAADISAGRAPGHLDPEHATVAWVTICDGLQLQYLLRPGMDLIGAYDQLTSTLLGG